jgi:hypothetical protein
LDYATQCNPPFYNIIQFRNPPKINVCRTFGERPRNYLCVRVAWDGLAHRLPLYGHCRVERECGPDSDGGDGDDRNVRAQKLLPRNDDDGVGGGLEEQYDGPWNNMPSGLPEAGRNILPEYHPARTRTCAPELDVVLDLHLRKDLGKDKGTVLPALVRDDIPRTR